jgi:REP element-mobilizing transposase RayT
MSLCLWIEYELHCKTWMGGFMKPNGRHDPVPPGPRGWHSRGYLPHFDAGSEYTQSLTFRLGDSVPNDVVSAWQEELRERPETERKEELRRLIEAFLDTGYGVCHLRNVEVAKIVEGALLHFDSVRYSLHAWVVMPNHVHALFTPQGDWSLSKILGSWKSYTSKQANLVINSSGKFWQEDYFDRYIRDDDHFYDALTYIEFNPVAAGLCSRPEDWTFSSARVNIQSRGVSPGS